MTICPLFLLVFSSSAQSQNRHWNIQGELKQLEEALGLVLTTASVTDLQAKIFGERLISLTLEFLYELMEDAKLVARQGTVSFTCIFCAQSLRRINQE